MSFFSKQFTPADPVHSGGVYTLDAANLDYNLGAGNLVHQVTCEKLDGGSWSVDVLVPSSVTWRVYSAGPHGDDALVVIDDIKVTTVRVNTIGLGGSADPKVQFTSWEKD